MGCACNRIINEALKMSNDLLELANKGVAASDDDDCICLFGVIRDCAYRIRQKAQDERESHLRKGVWNEDA